MQEMQRPMEFSHPPLLVRNVSAREIVHKISFKNKRKINRSLYGIGMPIEVHFQKPDNAIITKTVADKESLPFITTKNTTFLNDTVEDF